LKKAVIEILTVVHLDELNGANRLSHQITVLSTNVHYRFRGRRSFTEESLCEIEITANPQSTLRKRLQRRHCSGSDVHPGIRRQNQFYVGTLGWSRLDFTATRADVQRPVTGGGPGHNSKAESP
jgi:hypothetical protein